MNKPYALVHGIMDGEKNAEYFKLPIVLNERENVYEVRGIEGIRIITMEQIWPTKEKDLLDRQRREINLERERKRKAHVKMCNERALKLSERRMSRLGPA